MTCRAACADRADDEVRASADSCGARQVRIGAGPRCSEHLAVAMSLLDEVPRAPTRDELPSIVAEAVRTLFEELHHSAPPAAIDPRSRLDADLGFDSLARVELLERLGRASKVELSPDALERIDTVGDIVAAMRSAPSAAGEAAARTRAPYVSAVTATAALSAEEPAQAQTLTDVMMWRAQRQPGGIHAVVLGEPEPAVLTYEGLLEGAQAVAAGLTQHGVTAGAM